MKKIILPFAVLTAIMFGCNDDETTYEEQLAIDIEKIQDYLSENGLTAQSTASGLHYILEQEGTGIKPTINSVVEVEYTGKLLNGEIFDNGTIEYPLWKLIEGWQEGIPLFGVGGQGKLLIPSGLGYGSEDIEGIPANSVLIFDIKLNSISLSS